MQRPAGVNLTAGAIVVLQALNLILGIVYRPVPDPPGSLIYLTLVAVVGLAITWFFWQRRNWARILILISSAIVIINALIPNRTEHGVYLYMIGQAAFAAFLLFYLNRPEIREWFRSAGKRK